MSQEKLPLFGVMAEFAGPRRLIRAIEAAHEATSTPTIVAACLPENMPSHVREHLTKRGVAAAYSIDEALAGQSSTRRCSIAMG